MKMRRFCTWLMGLMPLFVLCMLVMPIPIAMGTRTTHENVSYTIWISTDRTSVDISHIRFDATDMDWNADWTLDDYRGVEVVYIDLFTEQLDLDYYIHNGEQYQVDIDLVGVIFYRPNEAAEFERLFYIGATDTINAGDRRAGTFPATPINPDELTGWQLGAQLMLVWYALEHPTVDPSDYEYFISATIVEVSTDDGVPPITDEPVTTEPPVEETTTEETTPTPNPVISWFNQLLDWLRSLVDRILGKNI